MDLLPVRCGPCDGVGHTGSTFAVDLQKCPLYEIPMSFLDPYCSLSDGRVSFTRLQASRFAKQIADDYNPIHDVNARRFCVPGDLLFAVLLSRLGLYPNMHFSFSGMVGEGVELHFDETSEGELRMLDGKGKEYLRATFDGVPNKDETAVEEITRSYVRFSGHNFPHVLGGLMKDHGMMINIDRPLVIYESMSLDLHRADLSDVVIEPTDASMEVVGKRGNVRLCFRFLENGEEVGVGEKKMVLSSLREYSEEGMQSMVDVYEQRKRDGVE